MNKKRKSKCPHPQCEGGFIYEPVTADVQQAEQSPTLHAKSPPVHRHLCPVCNGLGQVRKHR